MERALASLKTPLGKKLWGIGGCLVALVLAETMTPSHGAPAAGASVLRLLIALGAVCGLAWWLLKKLGQVGVSTDIAQPLRVVSRTSLGPRNGLALVEADGVRVLVAYGEGFARVLPLDGARAEEEAS